MIRFRPFSSWPRPSTSDRYVGGFRAGYQDTINLLEKEIGNLNGRNVVIQSGHEPSQIRQDGLPYSNARVPWHPGIIVSFDSEHGPLNFMCDHFHDWKKNLRGIAMTLERLRMADLYGVTKHGEQYRGWTVIEPPKPAWTKFESVEDAARWLSIHSEEPYQSILENTSRYGIAYRVAAKMLHPDTGGSHAQFTKLQEAKRLLDVHHGRTAAR
jgi:hypothetical protein